MHVFRIWLLEELFVCVCELLSWVQPMSPALQTDSWLSEAPGKPRRIISVLIILPNLYLKPPSTKQHHLALDVSCFQSIIDTLVSRLGSANYCLFFFVHKVLLGQSMLIAFCYHRNCMAYGTWNVASPSLEKCLPILGLWGCCTDWKWCDTVLGIWQLFSLHHYSSRQKVKVTQTRKKMFQLLNPADQWILSHLRRSSCS